MHYTGERGEDVRDLGQSQLFHKKRTGEVKQAFPEED